jgi:membrane-bound inhibitor of C-type lysozyme
MLAASTEENPMRIIVAALASFTLAACQTPCPAPTTGPSHARFTCEDGSELSVTFTGAPDTAVVEQQGYTSVTLPARIVGSGYRYMEGGAELRGRGMEVMWARPGAPETTCREQP